MFKFCLFIFLQFFINLFSVMLLLTIKALKKNLNNEEEFRSINHSEPIHIFLKIKPLSFQESAKQKDKVISLFLFI